MSSPDESEDMCAAESLLMLQESGVFALKKSNARTPPISKTAGGNFSHSMSSDEDEQEESLPCRIKECHKKFSTKRALFQHMITHGYDLNYLKNRRNRAKRRTSSTEIYIVVTEICPQPTSSTQPKRICETVGQGDSGFVVDDDKFNLGTSILQRPQEGDWALSTSAPETLQSQSHRMGDDVFSGQSNSHYFSSKREVCDPDTEGGDESIEDALQAYEESNTYQSLPFDHQASEHWSDVDLESFYEGYAHFGADLRSIQRHYVPHKQYADIAAHYIESKPKLAQLRSHSSSNETKATGRPFLPSSHPFGGTDFARVAKSATSRPGGFACNKCSRSFATLRALCGHQRIHSAPT